MEKKLPADFIALKEEVRQEMLRRLCINGSMGAYASSSYNYSKTPKVEGPIEPEFYQKIQEPIDAVNSTNYFPRKEFEYSISSMREILQQYTSKNKDDTGNYNNENNTIMSGCMAYCQGFCSATCYSHCGSSCDSNCSVDCGNSCSLSCAADCNNTCKTACSGTCDTTCTGDCGAACSQGCATDCSVYCQTTCSGGCQSNCGGNCGGTCSGGGVGNC